MAFGTLDDLEKMYLAWLMEERPMAVDPYAWQRTFDKDHQRDATAVTRMLLDQMTARIDDLRKANEKLETENCILRAHLDEALHPRAPS